MPDLTRGLLEAFSREQSRRTAAGEPPTTYGQFLDSQARALDAEGEGKLARRLRDIQVAQQAQGQGFGQVVEQAATEADRTSQEAGQRFRNIRTAEQARMLPEAQAEAQRAALAPTQAMGGAAAETLGLGALSMAQATPGLKQLTTSLAGGEENIQAAMEAARGDTGLAGQVAEQVGGLLPFMTAAGVVGRAGGILAATGKVRPVLSTIGKALVSPIGSFAVAGAGLRVAHAGAEALTGTGDPMRTLATIPAGAAQDILLGIVSIPMRALGRVVERGIMRRLIPAPRLAKAWGKTITEMPLRDIPAATAAKFLGGAAEFAPFSFVPNLVDPNDPTSLSPDAAMLFSPSKWGSDEWKQAGVNILHETVQHAMENGLAGALTGGVMGLAHPLNRPGTAKEHADLRRVTSEEMRGVDAELNLLWDQAAKRPEIADQLMTFLAEAQRLKESVAKQRGDVAGDLEDFGARVRDWVAKTGLEDGTLTPPKPKETTAATAETKPAPQSVPPAEVSPPPAQEVTPQVTPPRQEAAPAPPPPAQERRREARSGVFQAAEDAGWRAHRDIIPFGAQGTDAQKFAAAEAYNAAKGAYLKAHGQEAPIEPGGPPAKQVQPPEKGGPTPKPGTAAATPPAPKAVGPPKPPPPPVEGGRAPSSPVAPPKPAEPPVAPPRKPLEGGVTGKTLDMPVEGGKPVRATYRVVELDQILPSHDPTKGFAKSPGFPEGVQKRRYESDVIEQGKAEAIGRKPNWSEMVNTSPRMTEGPPTVDPTGLVLNGNGRAMGFILASPEEKVAYRKFLVEHAEEFGLDPIFGLASMKDPILVREVGLAASSTQGKEFAARGDLSATFGSSPLDRAARLSDFIPDEILNAIQNDPDRTFSEAIVDKARGNEFRRALETAIPAPERSEFFETDGTLTDPGKSLARDIILTKAIGAEAVRGIPAHLRRTLSDASIQLAQLRRDPAAASLYGGFHEAIRLYREYLRGGEIDPATLYENSLLAPPPTSEAGRLWLDFIYRNRKSPKKMREGLRVLAEERSQEAGIFGEEPPAATLKRAFARKPKPELKPGEEAAWGRPEDDSITMDEASGISRLEPERASDLTAIQRGTVDPGDTTLGLPPRVLGPMPVQQQPFYRGKPTGRHVVMQFLSKSVDVPIRVGRMGKNKKDLGFFKVRPEVARIRTADDIETTAHEVGHATEKWIWPELAQDPKFQRVLIELIDLGKSLYKKQPPNGWHSEGWAEFIRLFATDLPGARKLAPEALQFFDGWLKGNDNMRTNLLKARDAFEQYRAQGEQNRSQADIRAKRTAPFWANMRKRLYREWVEAGAAIEEAVNAAKAKGHVLAPGQDPFKLLSALRGTAQSIVTRWVYEDQTGFGGEYVGPGQNRIFSDAGIHGGWDSLRFMLYAQARESLHRWEQGINPGMSYLDAKAGVDRIERDPEIGARWKIAFKKFSDWNINVLNYEVHSGAMSVAERNRILKKNPIYMPLRRYFEQIDPADIVSATVGDSPRKRIRGSGRQILDIRETSIAQALEGINRAHRFVVRDATIELGKLVGMGGFVERIPKDLVQKHKLLETFKEQLESAGVDLSGVDPDLVLNFWEPKLMPGFKDPVMVHRNPETGEIEWYQVKPAMLKILEGMDYKRWTNPLARGLLEVPAGIFRLGATGLRAAFSLVTNPLRDFMTYMVQTQNKNPLEAAGLWAKQAGGSIRELVGGKETSMARLFRNLGGSISQPLGIDTPTVGRLAKNLGMGKWARVLKTPTGAIDWVRNAFSTFEIAPRAAEMEAKWRQLHGDKPYDPLKPLSLDDMVEMLNAGRQVTTDFMAAGRSAKFLNRMIPFLNQTFQSPRAFLRAWKRNPGGTALKGFLDLTLPALYLWWKNKDEEWYTEMPAREKYLYFHIAEGDKRVRIPRPFEPGYVFTVIPEALMDAGYRKDPEGVREALDHIFTNANPFPVQPTLKKGFTPGVTFSAAGLPVLAAEAAEQLANVDSYFNQPIVPRGEADLSAPEQRGPYTSGVATFLGNLLGWSPRRIDHAISGVFAGVGTGGTKTIDFVRRGLKRGDQREGEPSDIPVVGTLFTRGGLEGQSSKSVDDLYDALGVARERMLSKEDPETPEEFARRQQLTDAAAAVKLLKAVQRETPGFVDRQRLQREIRKAARGGLDATPTDTALAKMGPLGSLVRKLEDRVSLISRATDGSDEFVDMTPERRVSMRDRFESEILMLVRQFVESRGAKWTGKLDDWMPRLVAKIQVAKDPTARRPPRWPGRSVGLAPSESEIKTIQEEADRAAAKRSRRLLEPTPGPGR